MCKNKKTATPQNWGVAVFTQLWLYMNRYIVIGVDNSTTNSIVDVGLYAQPVVGLIDITAWSGAADVIDVDSPVVHIVDRAHIIIRVDVGRGIDRNRIGDTLPDDKGEDRTTRRNHRGIDITGDTPVVVVRISGETAIFPQIELRLLHAEIAYQADLGNITGVATIIGELVFQGTDGAHCHILDYQSDFTRCRNLRREIIRIIHFGSSRIGSGSQIVIQCAGRDISGTDQFTVFCGGSVTDGASRIMVSLTAVAVVCGLTVMLTLTAALSTRPSLAT